MKLLQVLASMIPLLPRVRIVSLDRAHTRKADNRHERGLQMAEMLDGLEMWSAGDIAGEFDFGVKRKKNSPLYQKLLEIQSNAKNPSRLVILFGGTPTEESERETFDKAMYDWEDNWSRRSDYHLENDDKTQHWWHLLTEEEQGFLNEEYKQVCRTHYELSKMDREDPFAIEFRYGFNPACESSSDKTA